MPFGELLAGRMPATRRPASTRRQPPRADPPTRADPPSQAPGLLARLPAPLATLLTRLLTHRRARRALLCLALSIPLLGGGFLLLRHSSLVAVQRVRIGGVHGPDAAAIEEALERAAKGMSTLDVKTGALMAAVAPFRLVSAVHAQAHFPHGLSIVVSEQRPVAALTFGTFRTAVAADGVVLGPALLSSSLPTLGAFNEPAPGQRLRDPTLREALAVLGAAPSGVGSYIARVYLAPQRGLTFAMRSGLLVYFGDGGRPHAKWDALARVLADPSATGADYVDVRVPERPAAGFPGGVDPNAPASEETQSAAEGTSATPRSPVSTLAESLAAGARVANPPTPSPNEEAKPAEGGEASGTSTGEATSPTGEATGTGTESTSGATANGTAGATPGATAKATPATGEPTESAPTPGG